MPAAATATTRVAARVSIGRGWLAAINGEKALALAQSAHEMDRGAEGPAGLALEMMPGTPAAEEIVKGVLAAKPDSNAVRLLYVGIAPVLRNIWVWLHYTLLSMPRRGAGSSCWNVCGGRRCCCGYSM